MTNNTEAQANNIDTRAALRDLDSAFAAMTQFFALYSDDGESIKEADRLAWEIKNAAMDLGWGDGYKEAKAHMPQEAAQPEETLGRIYFNIPDLEESAKARDDDEKQLKEWIGEEVKDERALKNIYALIADLKSDSMKCGRIFGMKVNPNKNVCRKYAEKPGQALQLVSDMANDIEADLGKSFFSANLGETQSWEFDFDRERGMIEYDFNNIMQLFTISHDYMYNALKRIAEMKSEIKKGLEQ